MRLFFTLWGLQLRQRFGLSGLRAGLREQPVRTLGRAALYLVALVSIGSIVGMYAWMLTILLPAFEALGMAPVLIGLVLLMAMLLVFFMGLFYLLGMLYFAKDTEFLASLPIPQGTVFASKFVQVLTGEILTGACILLPAFIVYGIHVGAGVGYWLRAAVVTLAAPCIPLALSALLSMVLMRFSALWRRRDLLTVIGSVLLMVAVMVGQFSLQAIMPEDMTPQAILPLLMDSSALLGRVSSAFPPSAWAARGLLEGGGMLLLFLGVCIATLALIVWLAGRIYYAGASAQTESATSRRAVSFAGRSVRRRGAIGAIFLREWRGVLRSPVYALNGLTMLIMGPLLLLFPKFMQSSSLEGMDALFTLLEGAVDPALILLALAGIFALVGLISPAASTTLSREGRCYYLLRIMPVSPARQVLAKLLFGLSVSALGMVFMGVTAAWAFGFSLPLAAAALALGFIVSVCPLVLSMLPDIIKPKLSWSNETEAIKQNVNSMMGMLIGWLYLGLVGYGVVRLILGGLSAMQGVWLVIGGSVVLGGLSVWLLTVAARRTWRRIEG